ncbi:MAG: hypothetical protein WDN72_00215 [Alphaproteobacteria bacterium]
MTTINPAGPIDAQYLQRVSANLPSIRVPAAQMAAMQQVAKNIAPVQRQPASADQIYAEVQVNGKTMATVYNSGRMMSLGDNTALMETLQAQSTPGLSGPAAAAQIAAAFAKSIQGTVVMAPTAQTPAQWNSALAALQPSPPATRSVSGETLLQSQLFGQES